LLRVLLSLHLSTEQGLPGDHPFDDEDDFDLRDGSSDVALGLDGLDDLDTDGRYAATLVSSSFTKPLQMPSRFEEILDGLAPQSLKRPRDSDVAVEDVADVAAKKLTKSEKRKLKKLKAEGGQAVVAPGGAQAPKDMEQGSPTAGASKAQTEKKETKHPEDKKKKEEKHRAEDKNKDKKPGAEDKEKAAADGVKKDVGDKQSKPRVKELPGGLKVQDGKIGTGPQAKKGNTVSMRYIGKLQNGDVFDKNVKGTPVRETFFL
jgi:FK506-binding nuclear protein